MAKGPYRTIVYVDGFNFYYGAVRGALWKWLDPVALFQKVLGPQNALVKVTSPPACSPRPAIPTSTSARTLTCAPCRPIARSSSCNHGHFLRHRISMEHANPPPAGVEVWKNEEKGSDVNLALHVLTDAWLNAYDCAVIVSNDSDLAESLRLVKAQNGKIIGLVTPPARRSERLHASSTSTRIS